MIFIIIVMMIIMTIIIESVDFIHTDDLVLHRRNIQLLEYLELHMHVGILSCILNKNIITYNRFSSQSV